MDSAKRTFGLLVWMLGASVAPVSAHEVASTVTRGDAVIVTLHYADGTPLAYEECEVKAEGAAQPLVVGRTDVEGRMAFVPEPGVAYTVRAFSQDGHGAIVRVEPSDAVSAVPTTFSGPGAPFGRIGLGVVLILGLFAILRRTASRAPAA